MLALVPVFSSWAKDESSRTDPDDDVVDVTSFSSLDVVEIQG